MTRSRTWWRISVWAGILGHFALGAWLLLLDPARLLGALGLASEESTVWVFNYALVLVLLSCLFVPAAADPDRYRVNAWLSGIGLLLLGLGHLFGVWFGFLPDGFTRLGGAYLALGVVQLVLLRRALRAAEVEAAYEPAGVPASALTGAR